MEYIIHRDLPAVQRQRRERHDKSLLHVCDANGRCSEGSNQICALSWDEGHVETAHRLAAR